ncbi:MAG: TIGR01777 family oxidoreductase [Acidobacteriota bacterium]
MHIAVSGGSGFLGRALERVLTQQGHRVSVLTRKARPGHPTDIAWTPNGEVGPWAQALRGVDAIVNLAGAGMADKRWTDERKADLLSSRLRATSSLVKAMQQVDGGPRVFVSGSGVGYYGHTGDERLDEHAPAGHDFVATMAAAWEAAAAPAARLGRLVLLRTSLVMGHEGTLAKMRLPFKLGVGGRLGSGRQWMSWIHVDDWAALAARLIADPQAEGPFNLSAPEPVTNAEFTRALGRVLHRPTILPVPAFALEFALGEMAELLLTGQRAVPAKALGLPFGFRYSDLDQALAAALR